MLKDAARLACLGMAAGTVAALWLTRILASQLYGISAHDPLAYAGAFLLLSAAALIASAMHARRAARADPLAALRRE